MSTISSFRIIENKHDVYRSKDFMKKFCEFFRQHAIKIIIYGNKKLKLLIKEQHESYENAKICYLCKEKFENKYLKDKEYRKVRDHRHFTGEYRSVAHSICNLKYSVPKQISIVSHNGSNYDYHFIIKKLSEEFKKQFTCLAENTKKYITFAFPIEKEVTRIDKNGEEVTKHIPYILHLLIAQNLWQAFYQILSITLLKEFIELNVHTDMITKNVNLSELNISIVTVFLNIQTLKML